MTPRTRLHMLLKEIGVDYWCVQGITFWNCDDGRECLAYEYETSEGELHLALKVVGITPEQAIAATVGDGTDLASRLREVTGLHVFAELFGFDWHDESDWDWHDVACAMADAIDATVGVGTCTIVKTWTDSDYADHWRYSCSECGYQIEVGERDVATGNPTSHANFCWNCGRKVIGTKEVTE